MENSLGSGLLFGENKLSEDAALGSGKLMDIQKVIFERTRINLNEFKRNPVRPDPKLGCRIDV